MHSSDDEQDCGPFAACRIVAEVMVVMNHLTGPEGVEELVRMAVPRTKRETLRRAADDLKLVGMTDIASLIRQHARRAKSAPLHFKTKWESL